MVWQQEREAERSHFMHIQEGERERARERTNRKSDDTINPQTRALVLPPKVSKLPLNSATDWGPSVKIREPMESFLIQGTVRGVSQHKAAAWISEAVSLFSACVHQKDGSGVKSTQFRKWMSEAGEMAHYLVCLLHWMRT